MTIKNVNYAIVVTQVWHQVRLQSFRVLELRGINSKCVIWSVIIISTIILMHSDQLAIPLFTFFPQIRQLICPILSKVEKPYHKVQSFGSCHLLIPCHWCKSECELRCPVVLILGQFDQFFVYRDFVLFVDQLANFCDWDCVLSLK